MSCVYINHKPFDKVLPQDLLNINIGLYLLSSLEKISLIGGLSVLFRDLPQIHHRIRVQLDRAVFFQLRKRIRPFFEAPLIQIEVGYDARSLLPVTLVNRILTLVKGDNLGCSVAKTTIFDFFSTQTLDVSALLSLLDLAIIVIDDLVFVGIIGLLRQATLRPFILLFNTKFLGLFGVLKWALFQPGGDLINFGNGKLR